jgi:DNA-binding SARP family transcriptional activator
MTEGDRMEWQTIEERGEDIRKRAIELLQQGERYALAGLMQQAEATLAQVWTIAEVQAPELANAAAWEMAWLLMRRWAFSDASEWVSRITAPPPRESQLWPAAQETLVQICYLLADKRLQRAATSHLPPRVRPPSAHDLPSPKLPLLKVMNLGHFQLIRNGIVLPVCTTHKAISLFRYLLTRYHNVAHKEELMELLWPNARPREAMNSLHVAVSTLRRHIDPPTDSYLVFEGGRYSVNPDAPIENDCTAFQRLCDEGERSWEAGDLARAQQAYIDAIDCYQGDYYVDNREAPWAVAEQERLLLYYLAALDRLGHIFIGQRHFLPAIECYQRLLERDGYREDAHSQLMRCYSELGRRSEALQQYKRCATILANDLGLEPMEETQALYRAICGISIVIENRVPSREK